MAGGSGVFDQVHTSVEFLLLMDSKGQLKTETKWVEMSGMKRERCCWPQVGVIRDHVYVVSGERAASDSIEVFDGKVWTEASFGIASKRSQSRAIFLRGHNISACA